VTQTTNAPIHIQRGPSIDENARTGPQRSHYLLFAFDAVGDVLDDDFTSIGQLRTVTWIEPGRFDGSDLLQGGHVGGRILDDYRRPTHDVVSGKEVVAEPKADVIRSMSRGVYRNQQIGSKADG